ncbi:membrane metallo-endopeptidase-like 1 [Dermacentor silvarum]|uniref:membrane metallo-endopeptidase-like 1 n=1 Tax=Dermacentor silvarum TaxID=543639 RepID=UPI0021018B60|nr:membrane metallo-endopeptidase-like 1 [Dermacentor silvarum]
MFSDAFGTNCHFIGCNARRPYFSSSKDVLGNLSSAGKKPNTVHNLGTMYRKCLDKNDTPGDFANVLKEYGYTTWPINSTKNGDPGWNLTDFFNHSGINVLFNLAVITDPKNASNFIIRIGHKPVAISTGDALIKYNQLLMALMSSGSSNYDNVSLQNFADRVNEIEALLVNLSNPVNVSRPAPSIASISELQQNFSNIPLLQMLNKEFSKLNITLNESERVLVNTLYYYEQLNEFLPKASSADLEMLYNYAPICNLYLLLEHASTKIRESFGAAKRKGDWDDCYNFLRKNMPEVIEYIFINSTSSLDDRNEVLNIAEMIRETFNATIENADWMNNESKAILQQKLNDMVLGIGCPDYILNITYIDGQYKHVPRFSTTTTILEMMYFLEQNKYLKQLATLRGPSHSDSLLQRWQKSALDVGAFYYPPENRIEIPWAMFHPPFFQRGVPRSLNFGAIGGLIAHEMLHAFDASAMIIKKVESNKNLDSNDTTAFKNKTKCFFNQYKNASETLWKGIDPADFWDPDEYYEENDFRGSVQKYLQRLTMLLTISNAVNYAKTLNEDIVDNGGLRTSFMAYSRVLEDECDNIDTRLQGVPQFSGAQLFFVSWAMGFCRNVSRNGILVQVEKDKHSPEQLRVNVALRNFKSFAEAFNCSVGSYMNPTDNERCILW